MLIEPPCTYPVGVRSQILSIFTALITLSAPAQAGWWSDLMSSVRLEADAGVMSAYLSGGLSTLSSSLDQSGRASEAIRSVGTGSGIVTRLQGYLEVAGHDLLFSYFSDSLWDRATAQAADGRVSGLARDLLLQLAGELRPDLGDLLGGAQSWVRLEYGRFEGPISEAWRFTARNGQPWFGGADAAWTSELLTVEAGVYGDYRAQSRSGAAQSAGAFLRYTQFDRPAVLGYTSLQDATLGMLGLGFRMERYDCAGGWCTNFIGNFIPFTGWSWLDLGPYGTVRGVVLAADFEAELSYRFEVMSSFEIEPYVAFRADWMLPFTGYSNPGEIDVVTLWQPDYLLWGPSAGLKVSL